MKKLILIIAIVISLPSLANSDKGEPTFGSNISKWISANLSYPSQAIEKQEEGTVYVSFSVSENGEAENVQIEDGISETLNDEAIKAVKSMPLNGLFSTDNPDKVYILPIKFILI